MTWVDLATASALTGYKPRTLAKLLAQGKISGERRLIRRGGCRRTCAYVSIESILAHRRRTRAGRARSGANQVSISARELICLDCVVPGDCDEDDPRCLYHNRAPGTGTQNRTEERDERS